MKSKLDIDTTQDINEAHDQSPIKIKERGDKNFNQNTQLKHLNIEQKEYVKRKLKEYRGVINESFKKEHENKPFSQ